MTNKIGWIDNLRAVACIMVVIIHSTTYYLTQGAKVGEINWDIANLLNSASRACVPLFLLGIRYWTSSMFSPLRSV